MEPHSFEHDGTLYEVRFQQTPEGWLAHIKPEDSPEAQIIAFPNAIGFDAADVRGSLIAGCEAAVARIPRRPPTRH